jgi:glycosyltransferase involved in cell wall biosynthesis
MLKEFSIFILAYNEEDNIKDCIESALLNAAKISSRYDVNVIIYEGSTDKTLEIVNELCKKHKDLRYTIQKKKNKGYGAALKLGIENAKYECIFYTDGDNQFDLNEIRKLLPYLKRYDIVSGYRKKRKDPFMRHIYAKAYNLLLAGLFLELFRDVDSAFKVYKRHIFKKIDINHSSGIADAEILIKARKNNMRIKEIPVSHHYRPKGKTRFEYSWGIIKIGVILELLREMLKLWKEIFLKDV